MLPDYTRFAEIETYKDIFEIKLNEKINKNLLDSLVTDFNSIKIGHLLLISVAFH